MSEISILPFVCGAGASVPGSEQGALYARTHGLSERLDARGIAHHWAADPQSHWRMPGGQKAHENLEAQGTDMRRDVVVRHLKTLAENVAAELRRGFTVVAIGGDHSQAAGSLAGVQAAFGPGARLGLLWIDAHPDIHTFQSSSSKALHGMPLGTLTGLDRTLALGKDFAVRLEPENIVFAGLRDIDEGEKENARSLGIGLLTLDDLRANGGAKILEQAAARLAETCDHIVLSIDLDVFSADFAPAVGSPVKGGFTPDEILPVLSKIVRTHAVPLIDIVEFNPTLPGAEKTFDLLVKIMGDLFSGD